VTSKQRPKYETFLCKILLPYILAFIGREDLGQILTKIRLIEGSDIYLLLGNVFLLFFVCFKTVLKL